MSRVRRTLAAAAAVTALGGCATDPVVDGTASSPSPRPTATATAATATAPTTSAPASTLPAGVDQVVRIATAGGKVVGGVQRTKVRKGSTVQLVVTSDVADEVHLHTYDKRADVAAGGTVTLTFAATIAGVFELELEKAGLLLTHVQVQ